MKSINLGTDESIIKRGSISCVVFPALDSTGIVKHGFVLRTGGVSKGHFDSLNLSYTRGDVKEDVDENFRRVAAFFGTEPDHIVAPYQTHTNTVMRVGREEAGRGVTLDRLYPDIDGLITNEPGLMLSTSHADCTPLFFVDPVHRAIGMTHSGWKGTAGMIAAETIRAMGREFGTKPGDLLAAIGPTICGNCYEIGPEVADIFLSTYGAINAFSEIFPTGPMLRAKDNGKYMLNLRSVNMGIMIKNGMKKENIFVSDLCTFENEAIFFSHRKMGDKRGNLRAFIMLNDENAEKSLSDNIPEIELPYQWPRSCTQ